MRDRTRRRGGFPPALIVLAAGGFLAVVALSKATESLGAASIPIWAMVIAGAVVLFRGRFGEAILHAIAERDQEVGARGTDTAVVQELDDLRAQVSELQERMDFTERLLARERETRPLGAGGPQ